MAKVSVIIPVYNVEKYLRECLDSVVKQTLQDIEIILINDGSTDSSLSICKEYAQQDKRIKVITYIKNKGGGYARNQGLKVAKGKYLAFLDSDDFMNPQVLNKIYLKCEREKADIGICGGELYDSKTKESRIMPWALRVDLLPAKDTFHTHEIYNCIFNFSQNWNCNKIFNHEFIKKNNITFQNIRRTNDLLFTCKSLVMANLITTINEPIFTYRVNHGTSCQQTNYLYPLDFYKAFKKLKNWLIKNNYYKLVEKSFIEWALVGCVYNINSIKNKKLRYKVMKIVFTKGIKDFSLDKHNQCIVYEYNMHKKYDLMLSEYKRTQTLKSAIQKIFSINNSQNKTHKIITILGIKINIKRG